MPSSESPVTDFIGGLVNGIVGWVVWAAVTHYLGRWVFKGGGTLGQMLHVLGYASAPNALGIFAFIPCLGLLCAFGGWLISMIVGVMAIKEALDVGPVVAVGVVIVGAIAVGMLYAVVGVIFGGAFSAISALL